MVFLTFLAGLLQRFLEFLNFLSELHEVMIYGITFLTAFLSGAEIGLLLSIFLKPTTLMCVVCGIRTHMLLAQLQCFSKRTFLGTPIVALVPGHFFPFLLLWEDFLEDSNLPFS